jgi:hypothetical protein
MVRILMEAKPRDWVLFYELFCVWWLSSSGRWHRVALIRTDVSEDRISSIFRVHKSVSYESVPIQELTTSLCNLLALVHPEDGGDTILQNVGSYKCHTVSSPRRW